MSDIESPNRLEERILYQEVTQTEWFDFLKKCKKKYGESLDNSRGSKVFLNDVCIAKIIYKNENEDIYKINCAYLKRDFLNIFGEKI